MPADSYVTISEVLAFLDKRRTAVESRPDEEELRSRYRHAAAVLATINDPEKLRPVGGEGQKNEGVRLLGDELIPAVAEKFGGGLMLRPGTRRAAIRELSDPAARQAALDANPHERAGTLQEILEAYLVGKPLPLEDLSLEQLQETLQVCVWLDGAVENLPAPEVVRQRIGYRNLLAPFETLAGDAVFRGRREELDTLRSYVGVLAPDSLLSRLQDRAMRWIRPDRLPAVSVSGPGGVGKSALIARFVLEHSRVPEAGRIPFSYLDFDRATLDIARPATLIAEMLSQLDLQFPELEFRGLLDFLVKRMAAQNSPDAASTVDRSLSLEHSVLADMLGILEQRLGPRPYIVVLDTFEEVQYRGENRAFPVWDMLVAMQQQRPFLRVVVSGRAPVETLLLAGKPPEQLSLGELDTAAAIAFLQSNGVSDQSAAAAVVKQVGGVPLSLKLAASLLRREGTDRGGIRNLSGRSRFWFSPADEEIQSQLYERLLGRIHDPRVERLAHPGLVLRRISPEVILHVLNGPCRLEVESIAEAQQLLDELRKETSLVAADTLDGSLVHRPDVRRSMLKLLVQKEPAQVEQIRRAAVKWYSSQSGWRARAEELYQRLQLGETITRSDFEDHEVRSSLQASISELPESAQLDLASLGFQVSAEVLQKASKSQYESHVAAQVEEWLPYGASSVALAHDSLRRELPVEHSSPLFRSMARVLAQQEQYAEAREWIEKGMQWAALAGDSLRILELSQESAWLRRASSGPERAQALRLLGEYSQRFNAPAAVFQFKSQTLWEEPMSRARAEDLRDSFVRLSAAELWAVFPALESVLRVLAEYPVAWDALQIGILSESGHFLRAEFAEPEAEAALQQLLQVISYEPAQVLPAITELCRVWPYRVLNVQPPYGSRGFDPSEAALAR